MTNQVLNHHLKVQPYPYQVDGIVYGLQHHRLIIGDEPGLGKTLQSIGIVDTAPAYPCLVICPSSLKINWQREFEKFTDKKAVVLDNATRTTWPYLLRMGMYHVAIVNYESLRKYFVWDIVSGSKEFRLKDVVFSENIRLFKSVIIDESHRVKDPAAQQSIFTKVKAGVSVLKSTQHFLLIKPFIVGGERRIQCFGHIRHQFSHHDFQRLAPKGGLCG